MKKKIFSSLLLVAFAFAATSMFVSCKDYDDDINELRSLIDKNDAALLQAKADLEREIGNLRSELQTERGRISTLEEHEKNWATNARVDGIENRLKTAEGTLTTLNGLIGTGKLDGKTEDGKAYANFTEAVNDIYARMESVESKLGDALLDITELQDTLAKVKGVVYDLRSEVDVLNGYKSRVETIENDYLKSADKQELLDSINKITGQLEVMRKTISNNSIAIANNTDSINKLKGQLATMSNRVDGIDARVNVLNVWLTNQLRSLVFDPQFYYWGIEAAKFLSLDYLKYTVPGAAYNVKENKGYKTDLANKEAYATEGELADHERYESIEGRRVLDFTAYYFMNPSTAKVEKGKAKVGVIFDDKDYVVTRSADYNMWVADWNTETPGKLAVKFDMTNKQNVKQVIRDGKVSVFATQVTYEKEGKDTTITSDFAAMYVDSIMNLRLAHTADGYCFDEKTQDFSFTGVKNAHCGGEDGMYLMATVAEAAGLGDEPKVEADAPNDPQDICYWDKSMDLKDLVEVRYVDADGNPGVMTADQLKDYGLNVEFALTGLYYGDNKTSESAHALLKGSIFKPQSVDPATGAQSEATESNRANLLGRTPLVRVILKDNDDNILDYGYIRILIAEKGTTPLPTEKDKPFIVYNGNPYSYTTPWCATPNPTEYKFSTLWYQTEYDMYTALGLQKKDFDAIYEADMTNSEFAQFEMGEDGLYVLTETPVGHATEVLDPGHAESATLTWTVTSEEMAKAAADKTGKLTTVIRYKQKEGVDRSDLKKYLYIELNTGALTFSEEAAPTATISWDGRKNANYWYELNSQVERSGLDEIHVNVYAVEDKKATTAKDLLNLIAQNFTDTNTSTGGAATIVNLKDKADMNKFAVVSGAESIKGEDLTFSLKFAAINSGKTYVGVDKKTYTTYLDPKGDDLTLYAYLKNESDKQAIAKLEYDGNVQDINHTKIVYQDTEYAKALLNYHPHNQIEGTLIAYIDVKSVKGDCEVATTCDPLKVRFLRPLNAENANNAVEDASVDKPQVIDLAKLVKLTDWRDAWKDEAKDGIPSYWDYYGVKAITIEGVNDGESISQNTKVLTNMNQAVDSDPATPLAEVTSELDFTYQATGGERNMGTLTYKNNTSNVQKFDIVIPVRIEYIWGYVETNVTIAVNKTHQNAKKN